MDGIKETDTLTLIKYLDVLTRLQRNGTTVNTEINTVLNEINSRMKIRIK